MILAILLLLAVIYALLRAYAFLTDMVEETMLNELHPSTVLVRAAVGFITVVWMTALFVFGGGLLTVIISHL